MERAWPSPGLVRTKKTPGAPSASSDSAAFLLMAPCNHGADPDFGSAAFGLDPSEACGRLFCAAAVIVDGGGGGNGAAVVVVTGGGGKGAAAVVVVAGGGGNGATVVVVGGGGSAGSAGTAAPGNGGGDPAPAPAMAAGTIASTMASNAGFVTDAAVNVCSGAGSMATGADAGTDTVSDAGIAFSVETMATLLPATSTPALSGSETETAEGSEDGSFATFST